MPSSLGVKFQLASAVVLMADFTTSFPTKRIHVHRKLGNIRKNLATIHRRLGNIMMKLDTDKDVQIPPTSVAEMDGEAPVVVLAVPGGADPAPNPYERPPDVTKEATGLPLCDTKAISFPQYDQPIRFPGILDMVTCGDCEDCPEGTTWAPVYVTMPVLTALYDVDDPLTDRRYVMDMVTTPVTCSCQKTG